MSNQENTLKSLREARKATIAAATERIKAQKQEIAAIKEALRQGGRTVPEIAAATRMAAATVLWYVATLKKYGEIAELSQDGSYFRYQLAETPEEAQEQ